MEKLPAARAALKAALVVALVGAAVLAVGSLRFGPGPRAEPPRLERVARGAGPLAAGASQLPLEIRPETPIAGFPRLAWTHQGVRDPVSVRAVVVSEPGCAVALVSAEILLVPAGLAREVERRLEDLSLDALVLAATHTHAGPGGFFEGLLPEALATGPYDRKERERLAARIAEAVQAAAAARGPATLTLARAEAPDLARNRGGGLVEGRLLAARLARPSGEPVARLLVFPAHPTLLGGENRRISGDWPGELMRRFREPTLFFQGALGDQSAVVPSRGSDGALGAYAGAIAERVAALRFPGPEPAPSLAAAVASARLPEPRPAAPPPLLRRLVSNLVRGFAPERARVTAVRLGPALLLAVPAEPVAEVGRRWREAAGPGAEVISLAGGYLGYVEAPERMEAETGETLRTYYGPQLAARLGAALEAAARAAGGGSP